jgi:hypothetical protein
LRRLSIFAGALPLRDSHLFSASIFQNLTHLDIIVTGRLASLTTFVRDFGRPIPWDDLQTLDNLVHLHLDLATVYAHSDPEDVALEIQGVVNEVLAHTPPQLRYIALLLPFNFLFMALTLPDHASLQVYMDLVKGSLDKRMVVGTDGGKFEYQEEGEERQADDREGVSEKNAVSDRDELGDSYSLEENLGDEEEEEEEFLNAEQAARLLDIARCMVPSARNEKIYRVCDPRGETKPDFWLEVEETVERRNREFCIDS